MSQLCLADMTGCIRELQAEAEALPMANRLDRLGMSSPRLTVRLFRPAVRPVVSNGLLRQGC
ncbi:hypothetical protein Dda_0674 [Drechslerella dactyloides]|uniref:Uncharacterized protein n=1 Tax=Drechslerella dactyloides TaxID=74499 RepID=A0AAD6J650_DREDA|nr:hypothetical protein Dda_0674 [Drechslerella dactyloides]